MHMLLLIKIECSCKFKEKELYHFLIWMLKNFLLNINSMDP